MSENTVGIAGDAETLITSTMPLVGARKRTQLNESLAALDLELTAEEIEQLESAVSPAGIAGTRYDAAQMKVLDSERV